MLRVATTNQSGWRLRISTAARLATLPVSNRPKQVAPEPDIRANPRSGLVEHRKRLADYRRDRARGRLEIVAGDLQPIDDAVEVEVARQRRQARIVAIGKRLEHIGRRDGTPGLTSTSPSAGKPGTADNSSPMPRAISGLAGKAHRHVGAQREADPRQVAHRRGPVSRPHQPAQRRCGIARPAADAGCDRQVLFQPDRDRRAVCQRAGRAQRCRAPAMTRLPSSSGTSAANGPDTEKQSAVGELDRRRGRRSA